MFVILLHCLIFYFMIVYACALTAYNIIKLEPIHVLSHTKMKTKILFKYDVISDRLRRYGFTILLLELMCLSDKYQFCKVIIS